MSEKNNGKPPSLYGKHPSAFKALAISLALAFAYYIFNSGSGQITNLAKAPSEVTLEALQANDASVFYCIKGRKGDDLSNVPAIYKGLHSSRGSSYNFALLDCNKKLPSGKTIFERFKVNRKIKPTIFMTAPWMGTGVAKQVPDGNPLEDPNALVKYVDSALLPRPKAVDTDDELRRACGWNGKTVTDDGSSVGTTCVVFMHGKRFTKAHQQTEEQLIRSFPHNKYVSLSASKKGVGLSFETGDSVPAPSDYALRVHAMRNGTHYLTMNTISTFEFMSTFVSNAATQPLDAFTKVSTKGGIKLTRDGKSSSFKERSSAPPEGTFSSQEKEREESKKPLSAEELEAARIAKEKRAREAMDQLEKESGSMVEEEDDSSGDSYGDEDEEEEEEEEEVMEL